MGNDRHEKLKPLLRCHDSINTWRVIREESKLRVVADARKMRTAGGVVGLICLFLGLGMSYPAGSHPAFVIFGAIAGITMFALYWCRAAGLEKKPPALTYDFESDILCIPSLGLTLLTEKFHRVSFSLEDHSTKHDECRCLELNLRVDGRRYPIFENGGGGLDKLARGLRSAGFTVTVWSAQK